MQITAKCKQKNEVVRKKVMGKDSARLKIDAIPWQERRYLIAAAGASYCLNRREGSCDSDSRKRPRLILFVLEG
jgi:hypothetical protein